MVPMRMPWPVLAALALACGPGSDASRGDADSNVTQPQTGGPASTTAASEVTTTTASTSTSAPTTSDTGIGGTGEGSTGGTTTAASGGSTTGDASTSAAEGSTGGIKLDLESPEAMPIPVHDIPGLKSITFYETTGQVTEYTFTVDGPELNQQLPHPLSNANRDIEGTSVEFYDVYYSEQDGSFNPDGSYLTIAGSFGAKLPAGGGLNLAEISLNYEDDSVEFGSFLASFLGLGDNYAPGTEPNAIDGDLSTHTTMGNNVDEPDKRLRVTLGFKSSLMPG